MAAHKSVEIYLNDHLAGATSALELMGDMAEHTTDDRFARFIRALHDDVAFDFEQLERVIGGLGVERERYKQVLAEVGETVSRMKLARVGAPRELSLLLELETLSAGIWTKTRLWRSLSAAGLARELVELDLEELEARGQRQLDQVEEERVRLARQALAG